MLKLFACSFLGTESPKISAIVASKIKSDLQEEQPQAVASPIAEPAWAALNKQLQKGRFVEYSYDEL
jgi:hypothetical protein